MYGDVLLVDDAHIAKYKGAILGPRHRSSSRDLDRKPSQWGINRKRRYGIPRAGPKIVKQLSDVIASALFVAGYAVLIAVHGLRHYALSLASKRRDSSNHNSNDDGSQQPLTSV